MHWRILWEPNIHPKCTWGRFWAIQERETILTSASFHLIPVWVFWMVLDHFTLSPFLDAQFDSLPFAFRGTATSFLWLAEFPPFFVQHKTCCSHCHLIGYTRSTEVTAPMRVCVSDAVSTKGRQKRPRNFPFCFSNVLFSEWVRVFGSTKFFARVVPCCAVTLLVLSYCLSRSVVSMEVNFVKYKSGIFEPRSKAIIVPVLFGQSILHFSSISIVSYLQNRPSVV